MSVFRFLTCFLAFFSMSALSAQTFSPQRLNIFYDLYLAEQKLIVDRALGRPPEPGPTPPPGILNYVPLVIENNTGLDSSRLYVVGKGQTLAATNAFFLQPDLTTGICTLVSGQTHNSVDPDIGVQLSKLPTDGANSYYIYVPQMISGRFYVSVDKPLYMETLIDGGIEKINDPSQTSVQDPNYYTLYQDFEFTLDVHYDLYTNVTNVDYFALPMTLGSYTYPTGKAFPTLDNLTVVGYPYGLTRSSILSSIKAGLATGTSTWNSLSIPFYSDPYTAGAPLTDLRILAAKLSIPLGQNGVQFVGADPANQQTFFDPLYLQSATSGPTAATSYMTALFNFYNTGGNKLDFTIFPSNQPPATYTMTSTGTSSLSLVSTTPSAVSPITIALSNLSTAALLSGAVGEWVSENAISPANTDPWQTEIAKILSALFTAGMLPPESSVVQPIISDAGYFSTYRGTYFNNPTGFGNGGQWYNLYDQVIHPLLIKTNGFGLGYAYDFDDLLDLAGLLHVNVQTNGVLNPYQPYVVLTAGPIDTPIPDPTADYGPYDLGVGVLGAMSNPIDVVYSQSPGVSPNMTYSVTSSTTSISAVYNEFQVKFYTSPGKTEYYTYNVYPKYQLVLPTTNSYNALDVTLMNGIVFQPPTNGSTSTITLPNTMGLFP